MPRRFADPQDLAACRALLRTGSRSFFAASLLLPSGIRAPATALYAFCRIADDEIDLGADPQAALARLRARLDAAYAGAALEHPVDRAFAGVVARFEIPRLLPEALIDGLAWDASGRRYESFAALLDYAARVAGGVGVMMAVLMGVRDAAALARAADLGVAMQLTNIARDVGEDARAGRLFLPRDWLAEAGIDADEFLADPQFTPALASVISRLLAEAAALYASAGPGIACLPYACRIGIAAARRIYAAIGAELAAAGHDSINRRARVTASRKCGLALRAAVDALAPSVASLTPALPANEFLIAAAAVPTPAPEASGFEKLVTLFERLERAQREAVPVRNRRAASDNEGALA
jgi:phytoene synthase